MAKTYKELKSSANKIKIEEVPLANTAGRLGAHLEDVVDTVDEDITLIKKDYTQKSEMLVISNANPIAPPTLNGQFHYNKTENRMFVAASGNASPLTQQIEGRSLLGTAPTSWKIRYDQDSGKVSHFEQVNSPLMRASAEQIVDSNELEVEYYGAMPEDREGYDKTLYYGIEPNDADIKTLEISAPTLYATYVLVGWFPVANKDLVDLELNLINDRLRNSINDDISKYIIQGKGLDSNGNIVNIPTYCLFVGAISELTDEYTISNFNSRIAVSAYYSLDLNTNLGLTATGDVLKMGNEILINPSLANCKAVISIPNVISVFEDALVSKNPTYLTNTNTQKRSDNLVTLSSVSYTKYFSNTLNKIIDYAGSAILTIEVNSSTSYCAITNKPFLISGSRGYFAFYDTNNIFISKSQIFGYRQMIITPASCRYVVFNIDSKELYKNGLFQSEILVDNLPEIISSNSFIEPSNNQLDYYRFKECNTLSPENALNYKKLSGDEVEGITGNINMLLENLPTNNFNDLLKCTAFTYVGSVNTQHPEKNIAFYNDGEFIFAKLSYIFENKPEDIAEISHTILIYDESKQYVKSYANPHYIELVKLNDSAYMHHVVYQIEPTDKIIRFRTQFDRDKNIRLSYFRYTLDSDEYTVFDNPFSTNSKYINAGQLPTLPFKKVSLFGTSIEASSNYFIRVKDYFSVPDFYSYAEGGGIISFRTGDWLVHTAKSIILTEAQKIAEITKTFVGAKIQASDQQYFTPESIGVNGILLPTFQLMPRYIDICIDNMLANRGDSNLFVIGTCGINDLQAHLFLQGRGDLDIANPYDIGYIIGAYNFLIKSILEVNPSCKIISTGVHTYNWANTSVLEDICYKVSRTWGSTFLDWQKDLMINQLTKNVYTTNGDGAHLSANGTTLVSEYLINDFSSRFKI